VRKGNQGRNQFLGANQGFFSLVIYEQNAKLKKEEKGVILEVFNH
jgi:hypothetical protein